MDRSDQNLEQRIKDAGCNAPRLSPADIERVIVDVSYTAMPSGKAMVCEITLVNGFTVRGDSAVVRKENFREDIGKEISYKRVRQDLGAGRLPAAGALLARRAGCR